MPEIDVLMQEWPFEVESLLVSFSVHMTQSSLNKSNHTVSQEIFIKLNCQELFVSDLYHLWHLKVIKDRENLIPRRKNNHVTSIEV